MPTTLSFPSLLSRWRPQASGHSGEAAARASLLARLEQWLWRAQLRELDVQLSGRLSIEDVERTLRHVGRLGPTQRFD